MAPAPQQRDLSAADLFREYGEFVARFLYRLGVPADAIDDAVQEVFLVAHQRGGYRKGPAKPTTYLGVIATNTARAQRRRARVRAAREGASEPDELRSQGPDPEHSLETQDQLRRLQSALDRLDPELRATLLLADGEGETCVSIGEAMGIPVGTVYWRLHEARRRFRRAVARVDAAAGKGAMRPATADSERIPAGALARSMGVVIMAFGWLVPGWRGSKAQALLRDTAQQMPVPYDLQAGLSRYEETLSKQAPLDPSRSLAPPPPPAASGSLASLGGAKVAVTLVAAGGALVAGLQLGPNDDDGRTLSPQRVAASEPSASATAPAPPLTVHVEPLNAPDVVAKGDPSAGGAPEDTAGRHARDAARAPIGARAAVGSPTAGTGGGHRATRVGRNRAGFEGVSPSSTTTRSASARRSLVEDLIEEWPEETAPEAPPVEPEAPPQEAPSDPPPERVSEVEALGRAHALLHDDPAQALALIRKAARSSSATYMAEERHYLEVMALAALGQRREARRVAQAFLRAYPRSGFREQVEEASE